MLTASTLKYYSIQKQRCQQDFSKKFAAAQLYAVLTKQRRDSAADSFNKNRENGRTFFTTP